MGLDMYLYAKRYIGNWGHSDPAEKTVYAGIVAALGITPDDIKHLDGQQALEIEIKVAYWRKANQIHRWFVETVQDGNDDCEEYHVTREQLEELVKQCKLALSNRDKAGDVLPPQEGFFFGGTDLDEYYFEMLQDTVNQLEAILNNPKFGVEAGSKYSHWSFIYHSSW